MALRDKNPVVSHSIKSKKSGITYNINHYHIRMYKDYSEYLMCKLVSSLVITAIIIVSILIAVFNYESIYIYDPLASIKSSFFDFKFFEIVIGIGLTILSFSKLKTRKAFKVITVSLVFLLISVLTSGGMLIHLNNNYNENTFIEMYDESYLKETVIENSQSLFIQECQKLNDNFQIKVITICVMEYMMIFVNFFLLFSEMKMKKKYDQAALENEILFDEEQNVKI